MKFNYYFLPDFPSSRQYLNLETAFDKIKPQHLLLFRIHFIRNGIEFIRKLNSFCRIGKRFGIGGRSF